MKRTRAHRSVFTLVLAVTVLGVGFVTRDLPRTVQRTGAESAAQGTQMVSHLFPQTRQTVRGKFLQYWLTYGGLAQYGLPITGEMTELNDIDHKPYTVQYFERAVFEYHPEKKPPYDILLSQLGVVRYEQKYPGPRGGPGQQPNTSRGSRHFPETGKRLGGEFLTYWRSHGGVMQQGLPISDEFVERNELDGKEYIVQYFERAVFELHRDYGPGHNVVLSQLGTVRHRDRYRGANAGPELPAAVPVPSADWEEARVVGAVDGDSIQVVRNGTTFTVRYLLIDAAESPDPSTAECYRTEAWATNQALVRGKTVYLEKDASDTDASGNLLRYVFTLNGLVNADLARAGVARVANSGPNTRYQALLADVEREARDTKRGLWGSRCVKTPTRRELFEKPDPTKMPAPEGTPARTPRPASTREPTPEPEETEIIVRQPPAIADQNVADRSVDEPTVAPSPEPGGCAGPEDTSCSTPEPSFTPDMSLFPTSTPAVADTPTPVPGLTEDSTPEGAPTPAITFTPETEATPETKTTPEATPTPEAEATLEPTPTPEATSLPEATPTPETRATPEATSRPEATSTPETEATPEATSTPGTKATPEATPTPEATSTPENQATPEATSIPEAEPTSTPAPGPQP